MIFGVCLLILSILVFVHELGHFVIAKWSGITVEEFAIGFPPRAIKFWQGEGSITLDGQSYLLGRTISVPRAVQSGEQVYAETGTDDKGRACITRLEVVERDKGDKGDNSKNQAAPPQPTLISSDKPTDSPASTSTATTSEARPTMTVEALVRPTEYSLNWVPLGGYVRMVGEEDPKDPGSFASKSKRVRLAVLFAGSAMNLVAAVFFFALSSMSGVPERSVIVDFVEPNTPAEESGLQVGDVLLGADGVVFTYHRDVVNYVSRHKGKEITLNIQRGTENIRLSLVPRINPPEGQGAVGIRLGSSDDVEVVYYSAPDALVKGVGDTARYVGLTFYIPYAIATNIIPAEDARPTGPVGIYNQTKGAVDATITLDSWFPILLMTAILSAALAVTNLLPLPALDGGRIFFILIEALRGKRVSPEREGAVHLIGLAMLLTLMIVITFYDIKNPLPVIPWESLFD